MGYESNISNLIQDSILWLCDDKREFPDCHAKLRKRPAKWFGPRSAIFAKMYFLSKVCQRDFGFERHLIYGAFSHEIANELDLLVHIRFIHEVSSTKLLSPEFCSQANRMYRINRETDGMSEVMAEVKTKLDRFGYLSAIKVIDGNKWGNKPAVLSLAMQIHAHPDYESTDMQGKSDLLENVRRDHKIELSDNTTTEVLTFLKYLLDYERTDSTERR